MKAALKKQVSFSRSFIVDSPYLKSKKISEDWSKRKKTARNGRFHCTFYGFQVLLLRKQWLDGHTFMNNAAS